MLQLFGYGGKESNDCKSKWWKLGCASATISNCTGRNNFASRTARPLPTAGRTQRTSKLFQFRDSADRNHCDADQKLGTDSIPRSQPDFYRRFPSGILGKTARTCDGCSSSEARRVGAWVWRAENGDGHLDRER